MSSLILVILLVSTFGCSRQLPINQQPQQPQSEGVKGDWVNIPLHDAPPQSGNNNAEIPADAKNAQVQGAAAGNQPNPEGGKAPNADNAAAGPPVINGDAKVEAGSADKKDEKPSSDKKEEKPQDTGPASKNSNLTPFSKDKANTDLKYHKKFNHPNATDMDSSTLKRLVLVLVAFSVLFIMYLAFRTYRRGKRRGPLIVSKYGVRTRRSDLEMRPLPLDDDDEDETVFDLGNLNTR